MRIRTIVVTIAALGIVQGTSAQSHPVVDTATLRLQIASVLSQYGIPGAGVAVVRDDSVMWTAGIGLADVSKKRPVTPDTRFRVGSVSKTFIALGVMQFVEAGSLRLDERLSTIAPEVVQQNPFEATSPVRVENLLEHTAGWDDFHFNEAWNTGRTDIPLEQVVRVPNVSRTSRWAPGTRASYSSPGYGVAGYLLEKIAGRPYEDILRDSILLPLGMTRSDFRFSSGRFSDLAESYTSDAVTPSQHHMQPYLRPAGNLTTTPNDFSKFLLMLIRRGKTQQGQLISLAGVERMETTRTTLASHRGLADGFGFALGTDLNHAVVMHGKNGAIDDGFYSQFDYSPEYRFGFVFMVNRFVPTATDSIGVLLFNAASRGLTFPSPPIGRTNPAELRLLPGHYVYSSSRMQLFAPIDRLLLSEDVTLRNDTLFEKLPFQAAHPLVPVGNDLFRLPGEPASSRAFFATNGKRVLQGKNFYLVEGSAWPERIAFGVIVAALLATVALAVALVASVVARIVRRRASPLLRALALPTVCIGSLVVGILLLARGPIWDLGHPDVRTVGFATATVLFAVLAVLSVVVALRRFDRTRAFASTFVLLVATCYVALALQMLLWRWIPLKLWL